MIATMYWLSAGHLLGLVMLLGSWLLWVQLFPRRSWLDFGRHKLVQPFHLVSRCSTITPLC